MGSPAPGMRPPRPHPLVVVRWHSSTEELAPHGFVDALWISHSTDLYDRYVEISDTWCLSAREPNGPLDRISAGVMGLKDSKGQSRIMRATILDANRIQSREDGSRGVIIRLTRTATVSEAEWAPVRAALNAAVARPRGV